MTKIMPINCGVMFQRNKNFWRDCLEWADDKDLGWYADQMAVAAVSKWFNVLKLHCDNFNYIPSSAGEEISDRYAVHYKGTKRKFMDQRFGL